MLQSIFNFCFGQRIDQSIMLKVTKVPTGEDPSAEVPRRSGGGEGVEGRWDRSGVEHGEEPCNCPPSLMSVTS